MLRASMLLRSAWADKSAYTSYINGWKPEETRKSVAYEQIGHWPKFSASEERNSEAMSFSESLKGRVTY